MNSAPAPHPTASPATPWWRLPIVWMVISGPAAVVVAGFATLALALSHPDPVVKTETASDSAATLAVQARNHAATGGVKPLAHAP
jgi:uncharacterized protein